MILGTAVAYMNVNIRRISALITGRPLAVEPARGGLVPVPGVGVHGGDHPILRDPPGDRSTLVRAPALDSGPAVLLPAAPPLRAGCIGKSRGIAASIWPALVTVPSDSGAPGPSGNVGGSHRLGLVVITAESFGRLCGPWL
jgi:hypothetical protein